jgi:hypothetical protein
MLNPFQEIEKIEARVFTALPAKFRKKGRPSGASSASIPRAAGSSSRTGRPSSND